MSDTNRRTSFRAMRSEVHQGTLCCGRDRLTVRILDESAGGFSVCAEESSGLAVDSEAELWIDNGDLWRVRIKHLEPRGIFIRIGLERVEHLARGSLGSRSAQSKARIGAATIVVATLIGYLVGTNLPNAFGMWFDRSGSEPARTVRPIVDHLRSEHVASDVGQRPTGDDVVKVPERAAAEQGNLWMKTRVATNASSSP